MLKKTDYLVVFFICLFLGIFLVSQYFSGKQLAKVTQPESNEVLALEVAQYTKANADLRLDVQGLTSELDTYKNSSLSSSQAKQKYQQDLNQYDLINGALGQTGQGVIITIQNQLVVAQIVDLINAIKSIGAETISINDSRISLNSDLGIFAGRDSYQIKVLGNSQLLKSALERSGGIIEQISSKDMKISVTESDNISIGSGEQLNYQYGRVVAN